VIERSVLPEFDLSSFDTLGRRRNSADPASSIKNGDAHPVNTGSIIAAPKPAKIFLWILAKLDFVRFMMGGVLRLLRDRVKPDLVNFRKSKRTVNARLFGKSGVLFQASPSFLCPVAVQWWREYRGISFKSSDRSRDVRLSFS